MTAKKATNTSSTSKKQGIQASKHPKGAKTAPAASVGASEHTENIASSSKPKNPKSSTPVKPSKPRHPKAVMSFRHNVLPPLLGLLFGLGVLGLMNGQWIAAQAQYRLAKPMAISDISSIPEPSNPNAPAQIIIPKLNLVAPVVTSEKSYNESRVQLALQRGVVQYGASANPGQKGNVVIIGHSSGQLWAPGDYKFVFTLLDKMEVNERVMVDFEGKRYIYRVDNIKIVTPDDLSVLQPTDEPRLTLITCTPVGTSKDRLIVTARQVSPNPDTATEIDPGKVRPVTTTKIPN